MALTSSLKEGKKRRVRVDYRGKGGPDPDFHLHVPQNEKKGKDRHSLPGLLEESLPIPEKKERKKSRIFSPSGRKKEQHINNPSLPTSTPAAEGRKKKSRLPQNTRERERKEATPFTLINLPRGGKKRRGKDLCFSR